MSEFLKLSEYINNDHPISVVTLTGKISEIEAIPTNEEVPEVQGYIKYNTFSNGEYTFNTTSDITPYFKITKDSSIVFKYIDKKSSILDKAQIVKKTITVPVSKSSGNTYVGSIYISEISSLAISNDELFHEFITVSSSEADISSFKFYIDYIDRMFYIFIEAQSSLNDLDIKLKYSEIFMTTNRTSDYFVIPVVTGMSDLTSYSIDYYYYGMIPGINTSYGEIIFNGVLDSISYRKSIAVTAFKHPYYNSYYDGSLCEFIIYNKYDYMHSFKTLEFKNNRYPSYVMCCNNDSKYKDFNETLQVELDIIYSGSDIVLEEIDFNIKSVYLIDNSSDAIYSAKWNYIKKSVVVPASAHIGSYTLVLVLFIPNSLSKPLSFNNISNFSLYNSEILREKVFYVNYDASQGTYIMSETDNEVYSNKVGFVTLKNKYDYSIYASDIRKINKTIDDQDIFSGNVGASPASKIIHPLDMAEYLEIKPELKEIYEKGLFDIDYREPSITQDILNKKPFNKIIEINNTSEISKDLEFNVDYRLEEYMFLLNVSFKTKFSNPNIQFYISVKDEIYKKAFYEALIYDKPYYNTLVQPIFDNEESMYKTFTTAFTILYNPILMDISNDKINNDISRVKTINFDYGLYNRRYNIIIPIGTKELIISTDGYSSEGFAHDKFGI